MTPLEERARRYLAHMPPSIQRHQGSVALFNVAAVLMKGFSFAEEEGLKLLREWNATHADPLWSENEMRHKIRDAARCRRRDGYLRDSTAVLSRPAQASHWTLPEEERRRKREAWPAMHKLDNEDLAEIAKLRSVPVEAAHCLRSLGLLWGAWVDGEPCFVIKEGTFAQARRFDGQPFQQSACTFKAKTLPGSTGRFVGRTILGDSSPVLLVEGVVGLLEAVAACRAADADARGWTVLAAVSAGSRFAHEPDLLATLGGRQVTIIRDADEAGESAALAWYEELRGAGASPFLYELPPGCKDTGDLVADLPVRAAALDEIFTLHP